MPGEKLGPKSLESEPGYLVNNRVCVPNTRSTPLGVHPRSSPQQGGPPDACDLGWESEEEVAYLGYSKGQVTQWGILPEIHETP